MSLHSHLHALDEVINRARNIQRQLDSCNCALVGPLPEAPSNLKDPPQSPGLNSEFQSRIDRLFDLTGQLENQVAMLGDQLIDKSVGTAADRTMPRGGY